MDLSTLIASRLRELRQARGWTAEVAARRLSDISGETIIKTRYSNWEGAFRRPKLEELVALSRLFEVPVSYLFGESDNNGTAPPATDYTIPKPQLFFTEHGAESPDQLDDALAYKYSLLDELHLDSNKIATIRAIDNSMANLIRTNDRVLIDLSNNQPTGDDLYAIIANGRVTIRWITNQLTGGYLIRAENPDRYPDQPVSAEDMCKINIIGRVALIAKAR